MNSKIRLVAITIETETILTTESKMVFTVLSLIRNIYPHSSSESFGIGIPIALSKSGVGSPDLRDPLSRLFR